MNFYFLNSKTNVVTNLEPPTLVNKSFSLFLIEDSVSLKTNSELKENHNFNIISICMLF